MPKPEELPTPKLVARAQLDRGRFAELYRRVAPSLFAWATLRMNAALKRVLEPEDVVQEVWCRALDKLDAYDPSRAAFRTWIFGIANHVILQAYRRIKVSDRIVRPTVEGSTSAQGISGLPDDGTSISRAVARDENLRACIDSILAMKEEDQKVFLLCGIEGLSAPAAAPILGASADAVLKRWQRLRERLRDDPAFVAFADVV